MFKGRGLSTHVSFLGAHNIYTTLLYYKIKSTSKFIGGNGQKGVRVWGHVNSNADELYFNKVQKSVYLVQPSSKAPDLNPAP